MKIKPPRLSGVYQIRCLPTGKIYVGSAVDLYERWYEHRRALRLGKHINAYLQAAWNKYGEESFEFSILELVSVSVLLQTEQRWIDATSCTNHKVGFNIATIAGSPAGLRSQVWEGFLDPDGKEVLIINLHQFCRSNRLHVRSMQELASGKSRMRSYRGWTHKNSL